jgi:hypothetical protein
LLKAFTRQEAGNWSSGPIIEQGLFSIDHDTQREKSLMIKKARATREKETKHKS